MSERCHPRTPDLAVRVPPHDVSATRALIQQVQAPLHPRSLRFIGSPHPRHLPPATNPPPVPTFSARSFVSNPNVLCSVHAAVSINYLRHTTTSPRRWQRRIRNRPATKVQNSKSGLCRKALRVLRGRRLFSFISACFQRTFSRVPCACRKSGRDCL